MALKRHGISIGIERVNNNVFMSMKVVGKLTHSDYELITPMIDSALEGIKNPEVNALIDCSELDGWELRAAWDDLKIGLKHGNKFKKIAIFGHQRWLDIMAKIGAWFVSGKVSYFEKIEDAFEWIASST